MKKFCKFLLGAGSIAAIAGAAYYLFKNHKCNDCDQITDETEDEDFDHYESDNSENREYVSINISSEDADDSKPEETASATESEPEEEITFQ